MLVGDAMRNAEFNKDEVLRNAMKAFLAKGYSKTSMQDLTKATGLHPGSIYCAFENKRGLLIAALEQYRQDRAEEFFSYFDNELPFPEQLRQYLQGIVNDCVSCDTAKACLSIKALSEVVAQDDEVEQLIASNLISWQQALATLFAKAIENNTIQTQYSAQHLSEYFVMAIYGMRTFAQTKPDSTLLNELAKHLYDDVCAPNRY